jgi:hypothetical protein
MSQACSLSLAACSLIKGRCYRHTGVILQLLQSTNICSFNQARTQYHRAFLSTFAKLTQGATILYMTGVLNMILSTKQQKGKYD